MKTSKLVIIIVAMAALMLLLAGCGLVDNLRTFKEDDPAANEDNTAEDIVIQQPITDGDAKDPADTPEQTAAADEENATPEANPDSANSTQVVLYFASSDGKSLEGETRSIPKEEGLAKATIKQLISGPKSQSLLPTLPAATILEDINISNGLCTVDFNQEMVSDLADDETAQMIALYSIVNTLTQFDSVDEVRILVDGQPLGSLGGVDASTTLAPYHW